MISPAVQSLLDRNTATHLNHPSHASTPRLQQFFEIIQANPDFPRIAIITCSDPRCVPERIFDSAPAELVTIRNAGGDVQNALSALSAIDSLLKFTDVMVLKHTDCGSFVFRDETIKKGLCEMEGVDEAAVQRMRFAENKNVTLVDAVKRDLKWLKESPLVRSELKERITGYTYDLKDGAVKQVEE